ncbi:MAG TPA: TlyA family RNA methyltransferase [Actinomycetota bacterium]|jgi:23S rRNA (cytidine1920-2'-O)/16S rRNA (cytidine1409-2'-O)-methyltransferase
MAARTRLDNELVRRGLATSRSAARRAIEEGAVVVGGLPAPRPATLVSADTPIQLRTTPATRFVSRGGTKLDGALDRLEVGVAGRGWLDAGASTGGFTDCLLQRGARGVIAVDVGYGQFDWRLRNDERVAVLERTNVRSLDPEALPWEPDGVVADLSFISLTLVLPALTLAAPSPEADFVVLVKPQFEAGRDALERGGVVRDPAAWSAALERVAAAAKDTGLGVAGAVPSSLVGPAGNHEFFLHLRRGASAELALERAVQEVS